MDDKVKELLDRIRSTAADAADAAAGTARVAGKRAGQMVDVAKLNVQLFDLSGVMYQTHKGESQDEEKIAGLLTQADELSGKIAELRERIAALRQSRTCPNCGAVCGKDDQFCRRCGGSL